MVKTLKDILDGLEILPMDMAQVEKAGAPDFEDILQYECAKAAE